MEWMWNFRSSELWMGEWKKNVEKIKLKLTEFWILCLKDFDKQFIFQLKHFGTFNFRAEEILSFLLDFLFLFEG